MTAIERFNALPGVAKMAAVATGGVAGLAVLATLLGALGNVLNASPQTGESVPLVMPISSEATTETEPKNTETDSKRYELWTNLQASTASLDSVSADFETQLRKARGQRWYQRSIIECQKMTPANCPSPYLWLVYQYQTGVFDLQKMLVSGKIDTDGQTTDAIRNKLNTLRDIASALTATEGSPPQPSIAVGTLSDSAMDVYRTASGFEALRQQEASRTYQEPIGGSNNATE